MSDVQGMIIQVEREQKEQWIQAVAVLSTLHPTLEVNINDPVGMAQAIHQHVTAERDTAKEIIKELVERLQWYVDEDEVNDQEGNEYWLEGRDKAIELLARAKELLK